MLPSSYCFFFLQMQKLEPWLVSKVKVAGGLNLLSALARGLPVSEDHDVVIDVEHLKAPSIPKKRLVMLVGVFSTGNNFERRMTLRRSWMQYEAVHSGDVAVRLFIGLVSDLSIFLHFSISKILHSLFVDIVLQQILHSLFVIFNFCEEEMRQEMSL